MHDGPRAPSRTAAALALVGVALGTWLRLSGALASPLYGDEFHAVRTAGEGLGTVLTTFDELGSHVALPLMQWLAAEVFGRGMLAFRLPALVPGVLALAATWWVGRRLVGGAAASLATLAVALSPMHVYYSRFGRSYALIVLLGLCLIGALSAKPSRARTVAILVCAALLPWVHLASAGYVVAVAIAAWFGAERAAERRGLVAALAGAVVLCALLYAPVAGAVVDYVTARADGGGDRPTSLLGLPLLLGGGVGGALALAIGVPVGLLLVTGRGPRALLAGAVVGPALWLAVTRPHGMEYAWARYLLPSLPAAWMLVALAWTRGVGRTTGEGAALGLGALLLAIGAWQGPLFGRGDAPFANTYAALRALPAFDTPDPGASPLYARLAGDDSVTRIVEAPDLHSRALLMYRNRRLAHGKDVVLGLGSSRDDTRLGPGPYVFLSRNAVTRAGAEVVVLHKDLEAELAAYWRFVFDQAWPQVRTLGDAGLMERHRTYYLPGGNPAGYAATLRPVLENRFGVPFYEDDVLVAWRVRAE